MPRHADFEPAPRLELRDEPQRQAFLHPLRAKILGELVREARTISQIAKGLGVHPANLTHHFRKLEATRLIRRVEDRDIGRVVERYYRASARRFDLVSLDGDVEGANHKILSFLRDDLNERLATLKGDDSESLLGVLQVARVDAPQFQNFARELEALVKRFESADRDSGRTYALNLSLYPHDGDHSHVGRLEIRKPVRSIRKAAR